MSKPRKLSLRHPAEQHKPVQKGGDEDLSDSAYPPSQEFHMQPSGIGLGSRKPAEKFCILISKASIF